MGRSDFWQERRELPWVDPVDAYAALRAGGEQAYLLLGAGRHPEARRSHIALTPVAEFHAEGDAAWDVRPDGATETRGNVAGHLASLLSDTRFAVDEAEGFTGGWAGFLGYEFGRALEPSLPRAHASTGMPDALLRLFLDAVTFDHVDRRVVLHGASLDGDRAAVRARLDRLCQVLQRPAPAPPPERPADTWASSLDAASFADRAATLQQHVRTGDLFQANLATRWQAQARPDPVATLRRMRAANPSPFMALLEEPDFAIVSGSPELLLHARRDAGVTVLRSRPIAGTRKRGADAAADAALERELRTDPKERAEHTMLVDLVRNDLARVARPGTVRVAEAYGVERYRHVMHLVSSVEAEARPGTGPVDWLRAVFPGGTVTGAPKHRACVRIAEAEPVRRGPYTGSAGYVSWSHASCWNILIRTLVLEQDLLDGSWRTSVHAGSGIVAGSVPEREWREAGRKAQAVLAAAAAADDRDAGDVGTVGPSDAWHPPRPPRTVSARLLLVDNYDSFVHNLADYAAALGCDVHVVRNDADWRAAVERFQPTHVLLSPGPGWPRDAGCTPEVVRELSGRLPLLGVCLGHQAMVEAFGGTLALHPAGPVHGATSPVRHDGQGLFAGLPSPFVAARYHSIAAAGLGPELAATAWLDDGTVMAVQHRRHPTYGWQFHPESLCTDGGLELLARFLETRA